MEVAKTYTLSKSSNLIMSGTVKMGLKTLYGMFSLQVEEDI